MAFSITYKPIWHPIDLEQATDGMLSGTIYVLVNPTLGMYMRRNKLNSELAQWLHDRPDDNASIDEVNAYAKRGNTIEQGFTEMWADLISADGVNPSTPDDINELRNSIPAVAWVALTAAVWDAINAYKTEQSKKAETRP